MLHDVRWQLGRGKGGRQGKAEAAPPVGLPARPLLGGCGDASSHNGVGRLLRLPHLELEEDPRRRLPSLLPPGQAL